MKTYGLLLVALAALLLGMFGAVTALEVPLLTDPRPWLGGAALPAAVLGAGLLVVDVFLPVPSSLLMIAHGALFGFAAGSAVSLAGATGAAALAFALGRWGRGPLERRLSPGERRRAEELLARWGDLAVVVSRPVPILAESVAVLAGTTTLSWRRFLLAALAGNLPISLLYAATGATAARLDSFLLVFTLVLAAAALVWLVGARRGPAARLSP
ncbi:MAG TPA: VTT domain-containing protein [Thermoanaerobaculia bacterium]|nr:VTT domain-containing protein [Thermoanaerobaculia bacterium]